MAVEIPATTAANYVVNLGAVGIVGLFFGMPMQDLVVGGMAGAVMLGKSKGITGYGGVSTIMVSTLSAGVLTQLVVDAAMHTSAAAYINHLVLSPAVSAAIGGAWPWATPALVKSVATMWSVVVERVKKFIGGGK